MALSIEVNTRISSYVIDLFSLFEFVSFILVPRLLFNNLNKQVCPFSCNRLLPTFGLNKSQKPG